MQEMDVLSVEKSLECDLRKRISSQNVIPGKESHRYIQETGVRNSQNASLEAVHTCIPSHCPKLTWSSTQCPSS